MQHIRLRAEACVETMGLLIAVAHADQRLHEAEREALRSALQVLELGPDLAARIEALITTPLPVDQLLLEALTLEERTFAFVAASWLAAVDDRIDVRELGVLELAREQLGFTAVRAEELRAIAVDVANEHAPQAHDSTTWAHELVTLFRAIPTRLRGGHAIQVTFDG